MTQISRTVDAYWHTFQAALPPNSSLRDRPYTAEPFGDGPELANRLGQLIADGTKTATCSALWEWEAEGEQPPQVGHLTIVLDGQGHPLCIIETTEVTMRAYNQVDARFAYAEGEDDRSLDAWRRAHWSFFTRTLARMGKTPTSDMPLICERFGVIHRSVL